MSTSVISGKYINSCTVLIRYLHFYATINSVIVLFFLHYMYLTAKVTLGGTSCTSCELLQTVVTNIVLN